MQIIAYIANIVCLCDNGYVMVFITEEGELRYGTGNCPYKGHPWQR
jgi:hypothetical protein